MSWAIEWKALSHRIHGLLEAGKFYPQTIAIRGGEGYSRLGGILLEQAVGIFREIESFANQFSNNIPDRANETLNRFVKEKLHRDVFTDSEDKSDQDIARGMGGLMLLKAFESEMSFLLSDVQVHIKRRSERAFAHLQRSIVADPEIRNKWQKAFNEGEVACEKLGAVHLLLHGIWAFKADGVTGGRTDLVLGEQLEETLVERVAEGLVLTEWKLARKENRTPKLFSKHVDNQFGEARKQAAKYARGTLAGIELAEYCFLVVVTERGVDEPEDSRHNGVVYRHINIAVDPLPPSRS